MNECSSQFMQTWLLICEFTPVELCSFLRTYSTFSSSSPSADSAHRKAQSQHTSGSLSTFSWPIMNFFVPVVVRCLSGFIPYTFIDVVLTFLSGTPPFTLNSCVKALISCELVMPSFCLTPSPLLTLFLLFPLFPPFSLLSTRRTLNCARCLFSYDSIPFHCLSTILMTENLIFAPRSFMRIIGCKMISDTRLAESQILFSFLAKGENCAFDWCSWKTPLQTSHCWIMKLLKISFHWSWLCFISLLRICALHSVWVW